MGASVARDGTCVNVMGEGLGAREALAAQEGTQGALSWSLEHLVRLNEEGWPDGLVAHPVGCAFGW